MVNRKSTLRNKFNLRRKNIENQSQHKLSRLLLAPLATKNLGGNFSKDIISHKIIGHWHEDGASYEITCPPQLRDSLLYLLHCVNSIIPQKDQKVIDEIIWNNFQEWAKENNVETNQQNLYYEGQWDCWQAAWEAALTWAKDDN